MRNPSYDPRKGDVLARSTNSGRVNEKTVTDRNGNDVFYTSSLDKAPRQRMCFISTWRQWAEKATTIMITP